MANVAVLESVAADVVGLVSVADIVGAQGIAAASDVTPFPAVRFAASLLPLSGGRTAPASASLSLSPPVGSWHKRWNSLRGIVYLRGTRSPFHRLFSSSGECGGQLMVSQPEGQGQTVARFRRCRLFLINGSGAVAGGVAYCFHRHLRVHPASSRTVASGIGFFVNGCSAAGVFGYVVLPGQETVPFTPQSYCRFSVWQCQALLVLHIFLHTLILRGSKNPS